MRILGDTMTPDANTDDPRVVAGMAAQQRLREQRLVAGERRVGWKAGLGTVEAMRKASIATPLAGFLTEASDAGAMTRADGLPIEDWRQPRLEAEVAVRLETDLEAGADANAARQAIGTLAPAIEIVDLGPADDLQQLLADNIFHRAYAIGPWSPGGARALADARLTITQDDRPLHTGIDPAQLLGDLIDVVRAIGEQLPLAGERLRAGDVIITGSAIVPLALRGGERFELALEGADSVALTIAPPTGTG